MGRRIIWMSAADGSWGGCDENDLIIVDEDEVTEEQMQALSEIYDEGEVYDILRAVVAQRDRVNKQ